MQKNRETVIASLRHAFRGRAWNLSPSSFNQLTAWVGGDFSQKEIPAKENCFKKYPARGCA